jgi:GT2 family glycosyltransferase
MIFVCIPLFNRKHYTRACLNSILKQEVELKVICCDDGSTDGTSDMLADEFPQVTVLKGDGNLWWAGATNVCVEYALSLADAGDFIFTVNNDTEILPGSMKAQLQNSVQNNRAIIGLLNLFYEDHSAIENSAFLLTYGGMGLKRLHKHGQRRLNKGQLLQVDGLAGKGILIPVEVYKKVGLYAADKLPHYHADLEFSIRAKRAGFSLFLDTENGLLSHQMLTGEGMMMTKPNFLEFIKSFRNIKSTHHLPSLTNFSKAIYRQWYPFVLIRDLAFIWLGFFKRYLKFKFSKQH